MIENSYYRMLIIIILTILGLTSVTNGMSRPTVIASRNITKRQACNSNSFRCNNGDCIDGVSSCDGFPNCRDKSDETRTLCSRMTCPQNTFRCAYGACIDSDKKCDGENDCADGSDEQLQECRSSASSQVSNTVTTSSSSACRRFEFQCSNGDCIDSSLVCDGPRHCPDGSDETITQCYNIGLMCPRGSFRCDYGACVEGDMRCDGRMDCADNSDEKGCGDLTPSPPPPPPPPPRPTPSPRPTTPTPIWTTRWTTTRRTTPVAPPQRVPSNSCLFPKDQPGTSFVIKSCNCRSPFVPHNDILEMICSEGYVPFLENGYNFARCQNGQFTPRNQRCVRVCSILTDTHSVKFTCSKDGLEASCDGTQRPGSKVKMKCQNGYSSDPREMIGRCAEDGTWDKVDEFDCTHECGKLFKPQRPLISHGASVSSISEYPWHAGLYSFRNNSWTQDCGGTIISAFFILTAAHCVIVGGQRQEPSSLKIAVGKYFRTFDIQFSEKSTAIILNVEKIYVPDSFNGDPSLYENDIAVIQVVQPIRFSEAVKPACINPTSMPNLYGKFGHIVGWGRDETGLSTETLKSAMLPYMSFSECANYPGVNGRLARDKFCAFLTNSTTRVLEGDSGGGLTFEIDGYSSLQKTFIQYHFIYGIVSVNIPNTIVSAFTDITYPANSEFINRIRIDFDKSLRLSNRNKG
ncbi:modular serine protease isoform X2 [Nilaparvata lugens]|uniref:modular serine protease isoform X2 n=1 Tax=Nilaparvata lugens TaxID=108931 RepID=UPI00193DB72B|nr:modular serine protease isoform X2 [Nilaparvata lugens]